MNKVNKKRGLEPRVPRGYNLVSLANRLSAGIEKLTTNELVEAVRQAGTKNMVVVTTNTGTVFSHVKRSKKTYRWTGWIAKSGQYGTFHTGMVKSLELQPITPIEYEPTAEDEFYYQ